jgi:hypothetical protein
MCERSQWASHIFLPEAGRQHPFRRQRNLLENGKDNEREAAAEAKPAEQNRCVGHWSSFAAQVLAPEPPGNGCKA